ncbi:MAG: hypothetical protein V2I97_11285 [Desulfococcaceae bacterium]|jgi:hypothetical protein|nr:hypothetical protein [Desulfococcaceae bacterium]
MKDRLGSYYYPFPQNKKVRMYVRRVSGEICFRMWNSEDPDMWEKHGWVPYAAIAQASAMYKKSDRGFDPQRAYDMNAAQALIKEESLQK